jgi:hypothetical protein
MARDHDYIPEHTRELGALRQDVDTLKEGQINMMKAIEKQDDRLDKTNEIVADITGTMKVIKQIVILMLVMSVLGFAGLLFEHLWKLIVI